MRGRRLPGSGLAEVLRSTFWFIPDSEAILGQQVELVRKNFTIAFTSWVIAAWVQTVGQIILLGESWLILWVIVYTVYSGIAPLHFRWLEKHRPSRTPQQKARELTLWMTGAGSLWALLVTLIVPYQHAEALILCTVFITGIAGGAMAFASPYLPTFLGFMVPPLLAICVSCLIYGTTPVFIATGFGAPIYLTAVWFFAANAHKTTWETIQLRFENQQLVESLKQQTNVAEAARVEAEEADLAKSKFLAAASHDLRQPIHALSLFLSALDRSNLTATQLDILSNADSAVRACRDMLETLLDFSRIEADVVHVTPVSFALQPMLYRVFNEFGKQADSRNLVLRLRDTGLWAFADPLLTELIIRNLLSNALRYTDRGGILVGARRRQQEVMIEIWDTGIGIAAQDQQEIFREFHQLGNPERDQRKGLGLGLAIVDGLCRAMKVRVSLESQPERGSVFRLHLPLVSSQQEAANPSATFVDLQQTTDWSENLGGLRILAIDDNESVQSAIRFLLTQQGCDCKTVGSIQDALVLLLLNDWKPEVLVVDYRLREHQTGGDAILILREQLGDDVPAIIITGDTDPKRLREAYSLHATLLHKPLTGDALYKAIAEAAGRI